MKKYVVAATALLVSGSAWAADMPVKAPVYKAAPSIVAPAWTGFYFGVSAGIHQMDPSALSRVVGDAATQARFAARIAAGQFLGSHSTGDDTGATAGLTVGFNWLFNSLLVGVEADINYSAADASNSFYWREPTNAFVGEQHTATTEMDWWGTVRARLGMLATPTLLAYVTGGLAYGHVKRRYDYVAYLPPALSTVVGGTSTAIGSSWEAGWTVGGGLEWAWAQNWIVGIEYLYFRLGDGSFRTSAQAGNCLTLPACTFVLTTEDIDNHVARVKLNYKFASN